MTIPPTARSAMSVDGKQFSLSPTCFAALVKGWTTLGSQSRSWSLRTTAVIGSTSRKYASRRSRRVPHAYRVQRSRATLWSERMSRFSQTRSDVAGAHKGVPSTTAFNAERSSMLRSMASRSFESLEGALTYETRAGCMERMPPPPWANIPPLVAHISESKPGTIRVDSKLQPDTQAGLVEFLTTR